MREALAEARAAGDRGEVPVGAVVVLDGECVGRGANRREQSQDPTAHAEIVALRAAARVLGSWRLEDCVMYVTLEPCAMCAGALVNARMGRLVYGAIDPKGGFCGTLGDLVRDPRLNHCMAVSSGILESECREVLTRFFGELRARKGQSRER